MITNFIYIMAVILGVLLGMSYLGYRFYRKRYQDIKSKFDEVGGEDLAVLKSENKSLKIKVDTLTKENNKLKEVKKIKSRRRGLHKRNVIRTSDNHSIPIEVEIVEVDRAKGKSKVEVLHVNCGETLSDNQREQICELVNGWIDDKDIEWFEKPLDEVREDKLDELLDGEK